MNLYSYAKVRMVDREAFVLGSAFLTYSRP